MSSANSTMKKYVKKYWWLIVVLAILVPLLVSLWYNLAVTPKGSYAGQVPGEKVCACTCNKVGYGLLCKERYGEGGKCPDFNHKFPATDTLERCASKNDQLCPGYDEDNNFFTDGRLNNCSIKTFAPTVPFPESGKGNILVTKLTQKYNSLDTVDGTFDFVSNIPGHEEFSITTQGGKGFYFIPNIPPSTTTSYKTEFGELLPLVYGISELAPFGGKWQLVGTKNCLPISVQVGKTSECEAYNIYGTPPFEREPDASTPYF